MNLYGEFVIDVEELYQERELSSIIIINIFSDNALKVGLHDVADRISGKPSVADNRILNPHICKFPAFADFFTGWNH